MASQETVLQSRDAETKTDAVKKETLKLMDLAEKLLAGSAGEGPEETLFPISVHRKTNLETDSAVEEIFETHVKKPVPVNNLTPSKSREQAKSRKRSSLNGKPQKDKRSQDEKKQKKKKRQKLARKLSDTLVSPLEGESDEMVDVQVVDDEIMYRNVQSGGIREKNKMPLNKSDEDRSDQYITPNDTLVYRGAENVQSCDSFKVFGSGCIDQNYSNPVIENSCQTNELKTGEKVQTIDNMENTCFKGFGSTCSPSIDGAGKPQPKTKSKQKSEKNVKCFGMTDRTNDSKKINKLKGRKKKSPGSQKQTVTSKTSTAMKSTVQTPSPKQINEEKIADPDAPMKDEVTEDRLTHGRPTKKVASASISSDNNSDEVSMDKITIGRPNKHKAKPIAVKSIATKPLDLNEGSVTKSNTVTALNVPKVLASQRQLVLPKLDQTPPDTSRKECEWPSKNKENSSMSQSVSSLPLVNKEIVLDQPVPGDDEVSQDRLTHGRPNIHKAKAVSAVSTVSSSTDEVSMDRITIGRPNKHKTKPINDQPNSKAMTPPLASQATEGRQNVDTRKVEGSTKDQSPSGKVKGGDSLSVESSLSVDRTTIGKPTIKRTHSQREKLKTGQSSERIGLPKLDKTPTDTSHKEFVWSGGVKKEQESSMNKQKGLSPSSKKGLNSPSGLSAEVMISKDISTVSKPPVKLVHSSDSRNKQRKRKSTGKNKKSQSKEKLEKEPGTQEISLSQSQIDKKSTSITLNDPQCAPVNQAPLASTDSGTTLSSPSTTKTVPQKSLPIPKCEVSPIDNKRWKWEMKPQTTKEQKIPARGKTPPTTKTTSNSSNHEDTNKNPPALVSNEKGSATRKATTKTKVISKHSPKMKEKSTTKDGHKSTGQRTLKKSKTKLSVNISSGPEGSSTDKGLNEPKPETQAVPKRVQLPKLDPTPDMLSADKNWPQRRITAVESAAPVDTRERHASGGSPKLQGFSTLLVKGNEDLVQPNSSQNNSSYKGSPLLDQGGLEKNSLLLNCSEIFNQNRYNDKQEIHKQVIRSTDSKVKPKKQRVWWNPLTWGKTKTIPTTGFPTVAKEKKSIDVLVTRKTSSSSNKNKQFPKPGVGILFSKVDTLYDSMECKEEKTQSDASKTYTKPSARGENEECKQETSANWDPVPMGQGCTDIQAAQNAQQTTGSTKK